MSRLTAKKEDRYFENEEFWVSAEEPSIDKIDNVYFKLAEFEDFMEEQGFEDLESFRWALNFMKKLNSVGAKCILERQNLEDRWKKLKKWFKDKEWDACTSRDRALSKMEELEEEDL